MITWDVDLGKSEHGPPRTEFRPDGKFLNTERPDGGSLKAGGFPGYRRISAVVCIEERLAEKYPLRLPLFLFHEKLRDSLWPYWERARRQHFSDENEMWIEHDVLVLHNPYAYHSLPRETWAVFPQLVPVGDVMEWTDGVEVVM